MKGIAVVIMEVIGILMVILNYITTHIVSLCVLLSVSLLCKLGVISATPETANMFYDIAMFTLIIFIGRFIVTIIYMTFSLERCMRLMVNLPSLNELLQNTSKSTAVFYNKASELIFDKVYTNLHPNDFTPQTLGNDLYLYLIESHKQILLNFSDYVINFKDTKQGSIMRHHLQLMNGYISMDCITRLHLKTNYHYYGVRNIVSWICIRNARRLFLHRHMAVHIGAEEKYFENSIYNNKHEYKK